MYYIIETQTNRDGSGAVTPVITKQERNEAEAEYHRILASAAISNVYKHGAIIVTEDCFPVMFSSYEHEHEQEVTN